MLATFKAPRCQHFCFPSDLISHITQNPSSALGLQKLQKTCKYFFAKNKIVQINNIHLLYSWIDKKIIGWSNFISNKKYYFNDKIKCWLINGLQLRKEMVPFDFVYRCNLQSLEILNQNLTLNEFNFLSNGYGIKILVLCEVNIRDDNEIRITIDQIFQKLPKLNFILYRCREEIYTTKTFEKMNALEFNTKIEFKFYLVIYKFSKNADILLLTKFVEKNAGGSGHFEFHIRMENSHLYKELLETSFKKVLSAWNPDNNKPSIKIC